MSDDDWEWLRNEDVSDRQRLFEERAVRNYVLEHDTEWLQKEDVKDSEALLKAAATNSYRNY